MTENEALNWKTKAIAFDAALTDLKRDLMFAGDSVMALLMLNRRIDEANSYIRTWWRDEKDD